MAWKEDSFPNSSGNPAKETLWRRIRERNGLWQGYMSLTLGGEGGSSEKEGGEDDCGKEGMRKRRRQERKRRRRARRLAANGGRDCRSLAAWLRYDI